MKFSVEIKSVGSLRHELTSLKYFQTNFLQIEHILCQAFRGKLITEAQKCSTQGYATRRQNERNPSRSEIIYIYFNKLVSTDLAANLLGKNGLKNWHGNHSTCTKLMPKLLKKCTICLSFKKTISFKFFPTNKTSRCLCKKLVAIRVF